MSADHEDTRFMDDRTDPAAVMNAVRRVVRWAKSAGMSFPGLDALEAVAGDWSQPATPADYQRPPFDSSREAPDVAAERAKVGRCPNCGAPWVKLSSCDTCGFRARHG